LQTTYSPETEHAYSRTLNNFLRETDQIQGDLTLSTEFARHVHSSRRKKARRDIHIPSTLLNDIQTNPYAFGPSTSQNQTDDIRHQLQSMRDKALVLTILDTGLKTSEICALDIKAFNHEACQISIQTTSLPLSRLTCQAVQQYLTLRKPTDTQQRHIPYHALSLFARHDKRAGDLTLPISRWTVTNTVKYWSQQLQTLTDDPETKSMTPTTLRHYFVTHLLAETQDIQLTQRRARHKHPGTTRRYLSKSRSTP
jgi:integrase